MSDSAGGPIETPLCRYQLYMSTCGRAGQYGGYCLHHSNTFCVCCGQQATHVCGGWVGSFVCGADICDDCDNYKAGYTHDCGKRPYVSITNADRRARDAIEKPERAAAEAAASAARREAEAVAYAAASDPASWTLASLRKLPVSLWAYCEPCGTGKSLSLGELVEAGRGNQNPSALKVSCETCRHPGHLVIEWRAGNGKKCSYNLATGEWVGRWPMPNLTWP